MIEISLLPVDEEVKAKSAQKGLGFAVPRFIPRGFGVAVVILLAMYFLSHMRASSLSSTLRDKEHTLSDYRKDALKAQTIEAKLPTLRERANVFQTRLEKQKLWSRMLQEIILCCPDEVRISEIKLVPLRTGTTAREAKELVISGFYESGGNLEMVFKERLQKAKTMATHYQIFIPMTTQPQADRTNFWIHCREQ